MDTITHGIVGALLGKALFAGGDIPAGRDENSALRALSSRTARVAIASCTIGAIFPDIDIFAGPVAHNPLAIMEWHRSVTHSLIVLPLWASILASLILLISKYIKWQPPPFPLLFGIYAAGLASHIFLDLVTNFGTMIWSPVQYSRPAWDWVFILDLAITSIALVPQLVAWCYREPRLFRSRAILIWGLLAAAALGTYFFAGASGYAFPAATVGVVCAIFAAIIFLPVARGSGYRWSRANWARAGLAILCVYIGLTAAAHRKALADVQHFAAAQRLNADKLAALPLPPTLTHWAGLVSTPEGVWRTTFSEPSGRIEKTQLYATAPASKLIEQAKQLREVQVYLWFARFPVWHERQATSGETILEISDVRFFRENVPVERADSTESKSLRGIRARRTGFTFEVVFAPGGKIVSSGFKEDP